MASTFNRTSQLREQQYLMRQDYCESCKQVHSAIAGCVTREANWAAKAMFYRLVTSPSTPLRGVCLLCLRGHHVSKV